MGLINKEVKQIWGHRNKKYFESKGYTFPKYEDEFLVKVEDLTDGSHILVNIECDGCGIKLEDIMWNQYKKYIREDKKYYCKDCAMKLYGGGQNKLSNNEIQKIIDKKLGWKIIEVKLIKNNTHIDLIDNDGYMYSNISIQNIKIGQTPWVVSKYNKYTIQNIKLWCKLNKKSFELISNIYKCNSNKIQWKCLKEDCGEIFYTNWADIQSGKGCPKCNQSKGENKIKEWLNKNNIKYNPQKEFDMLFGVGGRLLSYDFYLLDYNLLIEYQGQYHDGTAGNQSYEDFRKQQEHDRRKKEYTLQNNINLLEIWYYDFENIEKILTNNLDI